MPTDPLRLKHPVVLVHGLGARHGYGPIEYFYGMPKLLRDAGNSFLIAKLTPWQTIEHRARQLADQINERLPEGKFNLVGHSMGGQVARYLTSCMGFGDRVASVTTIGTPHRGSMIGDIALGTIPDPAFRAVEALLGLMGSSCEGLRQITFKYCRETLNEIAPDVPGVAYFSAMSVIREPVLRTALPMFWIPHRILKRHEGDNDGFVSLESSVWGEHICTYVGDHYGQIGQFVGFSRGLDYVKFYTEIFSRLRREAM